MQNREKNLSRKIELSFAEERGGGRGMHCMLNSIEENGIKYN